MSRLIDADALLEHVWRDQLDSRERIAELVEFMPTIEERKTGKWIVYKAPDKYHCGLCKCPFCGEGMIAESDEYNYCPKCGAKMNGVEEE